LPGEEIRLRLCLTKGSCLQPKKLINIKGYNIYRTGDVDAPNHV